LEPALKEMGIGYELSYISAHRNLSDLKLYVETRGEKVDAYIASAGMAGALPGVIAALTGALVPVIAVPLSSTEFHDCMDSLLSMVRMPPGLPVLVPGIGKAGLLNAAIAAGQILALKHEEAEHGLKRYLDENGKKAEINVRNSSR